MKKLLFAAVLSLAGLGLSTGQASAWLLHCHHCCAGSATICCRPYNAFSPSIFGSITADGCCPISFGNHGPAYGAGCYAGAPGCDGGGCGAPTIGAVMEGTPVPVGAPVPGTPVAIPGTGAVPTFLGNPNGR
jgi:hypothetical protein